MTKYYGNFKRCVWNFPSAPIQCCKPIILLDASFTHCSSTFLRRGRREKHKIVQTAVFFLIFVPDCSLPTITKLKSWYVVLRCQLTWHKNGPIPLWLAPTFDNFKIQPPSPQPILSFKSYKYDNYDQTKFKLSTYC